MQLFLSILLGIAVLIAVSLGSGLIIRKTARKQAGAAFYVAMFCLLCAFGYGIIPLLNLQGMDKALAYGAGAGVSALLAQYLFGQPSK